MKIKNDDWVNKYDPTAGGLLHYSFQKSDPNVYDEFGSVIKVDSKPKLSTEQIRELKSSKQGRLNSIESRNKAKEF
ncbi:hypothetical protein WOSG25_210070 [Weissella oryzae SG25]|uniref:Uncharacterized protein n=1 Tax=Weissella oryzae (strain DSM 25784 / JCM 18191 / LMG 30913 / SG25) TaxID=1329250 RepID=A0A069CVX6_WEIOS|nr:hypothetical protein [Weissella oryzae]GAK31950.1 hypothetical protein WOSG25_210070 [Weissella oryzae SG25]